MRIFGVDPAFGNTHQEFWHRHCEALFKSLVGIRMETDWWQRLHGMDRIVTLNDCRRIGAEEKPDSHSFHNIPLEVRSRKERGRAGWTNRQLALDLLVLDSVHNGVYLAFFW